MIKFLIERPIAVIMSFIAAVILGVIALFKIPVSLMPDIDIPEITVQVNHNNTSVRDMENTIVRPLRRQLMQISNLKDIYSETRDGSSTIHLKFEYGTDNTISFIDANEKIDEALRNLPKELERPRVIKASASDIPVFYINISLKENTSTKDFIELGALCDAVLRRRIEQLPEVALVDVTGLIHSELYISPHTEVIKSLGISQDDIQEVLKENNVSYGNIQVQEGEYRYNIRFSSALKTLDDVKNIYINAGQKVLQLKDISDIKLRAQDAKGLFLNNGKRAISLAIIKQSKAKISNLETEVNQLLKTFSKQYTALDITKSQDQTSILNLTIDNLKQSLVLGAFLAFILMFFFLKDIKSPFLIGFSIPTSLILSLLCFKLIGLSINIISLSGLILGIGMMIDNSIIVIDNIVQYIERGTTSVFQACIKGTNEVIRPLISSVLTTCAVFLPLLFLSGISGALFYDQAIAVVIGLAISLVVAITLLPVLYKLFHRHNSKRQQLHILKRFNAFGIENTYEKGFQFFFKYRKQTLALFLGGLAVSYLFFSWITKEKLPHITQDEVLVYIDWNTNISVLENEKRTQKFLDYLKDVVEVSNTYIGEQQFLLQKEKRLGHSESRIYFKVKAPHTITSLKKTVAAYFENNTNNASYTFDKYKTLFDRLFADNQPDLVVKVIDKGAQGLPKYATVAVLSKNIEKSIGVVPQKITRQDHIVIRLDAEKLVLYGISKSKLFNLLKSKFNVLEVDFLKSSQRYIPIVISDEKETIHSILNTLTVTNSNKAEIPIVTLLKVYKENDYKTLYANANTAYVPLNINLNAKEKQNSAPIINGITNLISNTENLSVELDGKLFSGNKLVKEMLFVLLISVLLLYFILAAQFESLTQPLIVLLEIPIDIAGTLILLYSFGASLNLMSMIGIVVMSGIIINDSILKIATINQLRKEGNPLMEAIEKAGKQRLKPILMTSLTTILALIPFLFYSDLGSELQKPFALAVIGGMTLGTFVSLYFIPLAYYYLYAKTNKKNSSNVKKTL